MKQAITIISTLIMIIGLNMAGAEAHTNQLAVSMTGLAMMVAGGAVVAHVND